MNQQELLHDLGRHTYAMLKPSPVHGIGVFALCDIPKGCTEIFSKNTGEWIKVPIAEVEKLPAHSRNLVETYCLYDADNYYVADYGFKLMDLVNYLNHSSSPNLASVNEGQYFIATKDIAAGEELLVDYGQIVEGVDDYE
jgi:SET domain-containing protein